jgi:transmembrane sensor
MNGADDSIFEQATDWHLAITRDDMDWDGFTHWLEANPRHRAAYDEIAMADAELQDHPNELAEFADLPEVEPAGQRRIPKWPLWAGGVVAASLAVILVIPQARAPGTQTFVNGDESRTITLPNGSEVVLGPRSKLTIAGEHSDRLALEGGAYFAIHHEPDRTLTIAAGGLAIGDVGTRFEVQTNGEAVRVEVAEGQVEVRGQALGQAIRLPAGRRILFDPTHKLATIAPVMARDVGEWREGRLTYDAAPLSLVAADLARYAGVSVTVPPPLSGRRFSGTLSIHDGDSAVRDLAQLMGLRMSGNGRAYRVDDPG